MSKFLAAASLAISAISLTTITALAGEQVAAAAIPDGNVWFVDGQGRHFTCPISGESSVVDDKTLFADWNGKRWYFCCPGCDKQFLADPADILAKAAFPANVIAAKGDAVMVTCSVTGDKIAVNSKTPYQDYEGWRYYFCCNKCPVKFAKSPEKYAQKSGEEQGERKAMPTEKAEQGHEMHHH